MKNLLLLALSGLCYSTPLVTLSIEERAGVSRAGEPVLMGVPLPEGAALTDPSKFTLRDLSGNVIPCEFRTAATWLRNRNALRWIHLDFQTDATASQTKQVVLHTETSPYQASSNLSVEDLGTKLQVVTGVLRFTVKKANFNLLDEVWIDETGGAAYDAAHQVVSTHTGGGLSCKVQSVQLSSANDAASTVIVERQGPMAIVLKATGTLKSSTGGATFHFVTRLYAYNNSKIVKMENTVENWTTAPTSFFMLADLRAEIPLTLTGTPTGLISVPGGYRQASLGASEVLYQYFRRKAATFDQIEGIAGGKLTDTLMNPKAAKPKDVGWAGLYDGTKGCAVGERDAWRNFPSGVEVYGNGTLAANLFAERANQPLEIYAGASRTLTTRLVFFNNDTPAEQRALAVGADNPLYAIAPPSWYCRTAYAFGRLAERKPSLYLASQASAVNTMDNKLNIQWNSIDAAVESRNGTDSYGFLAWGDITHYVYGGCTIANPWCLGWDGNYYDIAQMGFHHFARTGDIHYLDFAVTHANHIEDIHMCHFGPVAAGTGSNRYCPPNNHVNNDDNNSPGSWVEGHTSHHKTQSMYENYWMTGDPRALEIAVEGTNWARGFAASFTNGANIETYQRRVSHQMHSLTFGVYQTKNANYLSTLLLIYNGLKTSIRNRVPINTTWQHGFLLEAMSNLYYMFNDYFSDPVSANYGLKDSLKTVMKEYADWKYSVATENAALGYAFLSSHYGPTYLARSATLMSQFNSSYGNTGKDFAENGRSQELALYYYAIPESLDNAKVTVEKRPPLFSGEDLAVYPNPFRSFVTVAVPESYAGGAKVAVYDVRGKAVTPTFEKDAGDLRWNAEDLPAGVYIIRLKAAGRIQERRVTLLK